MIVTASLTGLIKTLLILLGGFVVLRFLGQLMNAKRNLQAESEFKAKKAKIEKERIRKQKELGKTKIVEHPSNENIEDVDYQEV